MLNVFHSISVNAFSCRLIVCKSAITSITINWSLFWKIKFCVWTYVWSNPEIFLLSIGRVVRWSIFIRIRHFGCSLPNQLQLKLNKSILYSFLVIIINNFGPVLLGAFIKICHRFSKIICMTHESQFHLMHKFSE